MFKGKLSRFLIVVLIGAIAILTVSFALPPTGRETYLDYAQRHQSETVVRSAESGNASNSDYYQRHPSDLNVEASANMDAFIRYSKLKSGSANRADTSDYYMRHVYDR